MDNTTSRHQAKRKTEAAAATTQVWNKFLICKSGEDKNSLIEHEIERGTENESERENKNWWKKETKKNLFDLPLMSLN